jgi:hypothetical protein
MSLPDRAKGGPGAPRASPVPLALLLLAAACAGKPPAPGLPEKPRATEAYTKGDALLREGRLDDAIRELSRAVALEPTAASPRLDLGWAWFHSGDYRKAESEFRAALVLDADHAPSHHALASALYALGSFGEAAAEYRRGWTAAGGPSEAPDSAILQALALERAGGASAAEARRLLQEWSGSLNGPWRTLARHLAGHATEEQVSRERWGGEAERALAAYAVAAGHLARGDAAGARERLRRLAASGGPPGRGLASALARADLKSLP